jgi:hypothetical protein
VLKLADALVRRRVGVPVHTLPAVPEMANPVEKNAIRMLDSVQRIRIHSGGGNTQCAVAIGVEREQNAIIAIRYLLGNVSADQLF